MSRLHPKAVSWSTVTVSLPISSQESAVSAGSGNTLNQGRSGQQYHRLAGTFPTAVSHIWICIFRFPAWRLPPLCSDLRKLNLGLNLASHVHLFHLTGSLQSISVWLWNMHCPPLCSFGWEAVPGSFAEAAGASCKCCAMRTWGDCLWPCFTLSASGHQQVWDFKPSLSQRLHLRCVHQPLQTVYKSSFTCRAYTQHRSPAQTGIRWFWVQPVSQYHHEKGRLPL